MKRATRCEKCGVEKDVGVPCPRCGQPPTTYTSTTPANQRFGTIEKLIDLAEQECDEAAVSARAELAALREENARMREALALHKHTDDCLAYAAKTGQPFCVVQCADSHRSALSSPAPAEACVTLEQLREIEWAATAVEAPPKEVALSYDFCPVCRREMNDGHAPDCWLAAAIRDAGVDGEARL